MGKLSCSLSTHFGFYFLFLKFKLLKTHELKESVHLFPPQILCVHLCIEQGTSLSVVYELAIFLI